MQTLEDSFPLLNAEQGNGAGDAQIADMLGMDSPIAEAPVAELTASEAPVAEAPVAEAPVTEAPGVEASPEPTEPSAGSDDATPGESQG